MNTASARHVDKMFFVNASTHGRPAGQGDVVGRPHLGSVEPVLCATSFPHVILPITIPYFLMTANSDDNPDLLNFAVVGFEIACRMSSQLQSC
jgi:hypothetical protein